MCAYFPYPCNILLNGHEYAKRAATAARIGFTVLDNGFATTDDPAGLQQLCDGLGLGQIRVFCERWWARLPLPLTVEAAPLGLARGGLDGTCAAEGREGCLGVEPFGIVPGGDQQRAAVSGPTPCRCSSSGACAARVSRRGSQRGRDPTTRLCLRAPRLTSVTIAQLTTSRSPTRLDVSRPGPSRLGG